MPSISPTFNAVGQSTELEVTDGKVLTYTLTPGVNDILMLQRRLDGEAAPGTTLLVGSAAAATLTHSGTTGYYSVACAACPSGSATASLSVPADAVVPVASWGEIDGTLSDQTDLNSALSGKESAISAGTTAQYWRGDKTWQTLPTSGGGNSVLVTVDFGASFTDKASTVVTGQAWVTGASCIVPTVLTPTGTDPDEMYLIGLRVAVGSLVAGVGFTVTAYSEAEARGQYQIMCVGV
jgi:hypothetical protein